MSPGGGDEISMVCNTGGIGPCPIADVSHSTFHLYTEVLCFDTQVLASSLMLQSVVEY